MPVETGVLRCHGGVYDMGGQFIVIDECPVFYMERSQDFTVLSQNLGRKLAVRVLQLLERGDFCKERDSQQKKGDSKHREGQKTPEHGCYSLLCFRFHSQFYNSQN